ncbi:aldolase/citrate lyase family protein [Haloferax sp. AB510]|uniref:HpcH/HpaI aldolase family protein n=1 Tax=unclassified Haloferax TaxID=2625095 RepID=UPI0005B1F420|nr:MULTISPECIES: aldolase/citrate lyase family protein [unclassified Haloferax]MCO8265403.1 aldolase/citrate lyase family protein [Haloferax sp. AB510]
MEQLINLDKSDYSVGTWVTIGNPTVAEIGASLGLNFVVIDTEHSTMGLETVENMVRGIGATGDDTASIVRVPGNDNVHIKRVLDIGVDGIIVPMIETADEARSLVEAVRYPPEGIRGIASGRASEYGSDFVEYVENAEEQIVTIAQIESKRGVENAKEIASVDGIDALFLGPADLSGSLGIFAQWESEVLNEHIERVVEVSEEVDKPIGTLIINQEDIEKRVSQGFDYLAVGKDTALLASGTKEMVSEYERSIAETEQSYSTPK